MLNQGYRGSRYSFGYPACPNLADQRQLLDLLGAAEIGLALSEEDQLDPEQSTSAIVSTTRRRSIFRSSAMSDEIESCPVALFSPSPPESGGEGRVRGVPAAESAPRCDRVKRN